MASGNLTREYACLLMYLSKQPEEMHMLITCFVAAAQTGLALDDNSTRANQSEEPWGNCTRRRLSDC